MFRALGKSLLLLGISAGTAMAAPITWNFNSGSNCSNPSLCFGNSRNYSADGVDVAASAWSNTKGSTNVKVENAYLATWSGGLGIYNRDYVNGTDTNEHRDPEHAIDNNGRYDMVLLGFSYEIELTSLKLGWKSTDSDMTVLAYTGAGAPTLAGLGWGDLLSNSWSLVGNYANLATNTNVSINSAGLSSSYWLIGTYNSVFGSGSGLGTGNDYVKLKAVSGEKVTRVDEPAVLGLMGLGLLGLGLARRRG